MMNILLDTHIFLWYITKDERLEKKRADIIADYNNRVFVSTASIWECCIKQHIGKLSLPSEPAKYLQTQRVRHQFQPLPIDENCLKHLSSLPDIHNDPFDRVLISQAVEFHLRFMTDDFKIKQYTLPNINFI